MKERNVQDCFIAQYFSVEKGNGGRPETWERLKEVLMDNLQKRQAGHEGRLPGGFAFSLREEVPAGLLLLPCWKDCWGVS